MALDFAHTASNGSAPAACEIYSTYERLFTEQVSQGVRRPFVFPYNFFSIFSLTIYLCIPHKQNPIIYAVRWPLIVLIVWFELRLIKETSGVGLTLGYLTGLLSAYTVMLSSTWLIFKRPQWDAKRIERRLIRVNSDINKAQLSEKTLTNGELREVNQANGFGRENGFVGASKEHNRKDNRETYTYKYFWQPYPETLRERLSWVIDLLMSSRGSGWNWSISSIPAIKPDNLSQMESLQPLDARSKINSANKKQHNNGSLLPLLYTYIFFYLTVDVLKILMMRDPYFNLGPNIYQLRPSLQTLHPFTLQLYRSAVTSITLISGMTMSFTLIKIYMTYVLGPRILGFRFDPCYYPRLWGDFHDVLRKGLRGLWGDFWHQMFRVYFTAPTDYLIRKGYLKSSHYTTRIFALFTAFGISGFLHWAGSMTSITPSKPFDAVIFFTLQAVGIILQVILATLLHPLITKLSNLVRYTGNILFTLSWLFLTGWLAADDFARCGLWLFEPIPFSPLNALGLRDINTCHDVSKTFNIRWHTGNHWWESGIGLI